jgi:small subunit ribosomal protein S14
MSTAAQEAKCKLLNEKKAKGELKFKTKAFNRCALTGKARGFIRRFGLSRHEFRRLANLGLLPGVTKASW